MSFHFHFIFVWKNTKFYMIWGLLEKTQLHFYVLESSISLFNLVMEFLQWLMYILLIYLQLCSECAQDKITKDLGINVFSCAE